MDRSGPRPLVLGFALLGFALLALAITASTATAAPVCSSPSACAAQCRDGAGDQEACTALAESLLSGRGIEPDRPKALKLVTKACGIDDDDFDAPAVALACVILGDLRKDGWLFEIDRTDTYVAAYQRAINRAPCNDGNLAGCYPRARAEAALALLAPTDPNAIAGGTKPAAADAELGCTKGRQTTSCVLLQTLAYRTPDATESKHRREAAAAGLLTACTGDNDVDACLEVNDIGAASAVKPVLERACDDGDGRACGYVRHAAVVAAYRNPAAMKTAVAALIASCDGDGHQRCAALATDLIYGRPNVGLAADPEAGIALAERRCALGDSAGCLAAAQAYGPHGAEALRDPAKARATADRTCRLVSFNQFCPCDDPTVPGCVVRALYSDYRACDRDEVGACVRVATHFRDGDGVDQDIPRAAGYLRRGCDAADKVACSTLDELCVANPELPLDLCQQSLIQSDLFFEAEFQAASGGDVDMVDPDAIGTSPRDPNAITIADVAASVPTSARRGKLDADLVVDIVLDRARQAAIKLVVRELLSAERRAGYRYLQDLLDQGARLLADPTTLRREKFQDLGMTVVRAFVAANLIDGLYPTTDELRAAPGIGETVTLGARALGTEPKLPLSSEMHGYLVDVAYHWLGQTRLFGRSSSQAAELPACPWTSPEGQNLCTQLAERAVAERAIGVAKVLDALRLVKLLRGGGFEDVRRLIEAASASRTIANLKTTPGLNLQNWQDQIIVGSRERVERIQSGVTNLLVLLRASTYSEAGRPLDELIEAMQSGRTAMGTPSIRLGIGTGNADRILQILRIIDAAKFEVQRAGTPDGPPTGALDPRTLAQAKVRKDVMDALRAWGPRESLATTTKLEAIAKSLDALRPALDKLDASIADVRAVFRRFPGPDRSVSYDVGDLPLYASVDLTRELKACAAALKDVDDGLRAVFPGEVPARLRFARTSTARLIAFLDLMQRVARQSPLSMRAGDVIGALRTLGTTRVDGFDAPLYDVLEPVLDAIKTHEPMSLELLFAVIGRVRLDTLISSLQGRKNACTNDTSVDCWVTKLIHALQESVEREGESIRVDGGKFAQRLAQHGDDFRHKHTWRSYFHLTVGVGSLYSDPTGDDSATRRPVPVIAEQVGFGMASPSFLGDRLTFKVGAAASGILYRALLDSDESNAIMLHPLFLALDVGDLVEAYVSPATIMVYPPSGGSDGALRWGVSAGLSVPLSSYLERL